MKILALIDDLLVVEQFKQIVDGQFAGKVQVDYAFTYNVGHRQTESYKPINIKDQENDLSEQYDLIFSLCSQIFPEKLVKNTRCINFHFGIMPYVCGAAPITFSIINNIPLGVTVHLMDEKIDHGDIIYQEKIQTSDYDTAKDIESKCQNKLIEILKKHMSDLIYKRYITIQAQGQRRYFSLKDLANLSNINLNQTMTARQWLNFLRAMQFGCKGNAYFVSETGEKIKISVQFEKDEI